MALTPGIKSTEYKIFKGVSVAVVLIAVLSSLGKVPFTPDQVGTYLSGVTSESAEYLKVFAPYISILAGAYMWLRTSLKGKQIDKEIVAEAVTKE